MASSSAPVALIAPAAKATGKKPKPRHTSVAMQNLRQQKEDVKKTLKDLRREMSKDSLYECSCIPVSGVQEYHELLQCHFVLT